MNHPDVAKSTDEELLARFESGCDQRAFAEIVRRHGPMVMATSRRTLSNTHDIDDVFQATFLTLAKGSTSIRNKSALAGWLHRVSHTCALKVANLNHRWKDKANEMNGHSAKNGFDEPESRESTPEESASNEELRNLLDKELAALPSKLHVALVLCDLGGMTHKQAAKQLGISSSAVSERISKGRKKLRDRLTRHGITFGIAGLVGCVAASKTPASASITPGLVSATTKQSLLFAAADSPMELGKSAQLALDVLSSIRTGKVLLTCIAALAVAMTVFSGILIAERVTSSLSPPTKEISFYEDFSDGNFADGQPAMWTRSKLHSVGTFDASSGDLVLSPTSDDRDTRIAIGVDDRVARDISARTQVRTTETGGFAFLSVRGINGATRCYFAGVGHAPEWGGSFLTAGRADSDSANNFFPPLKGAAPVVQLPYDVRKRDTIIQIDAIGDTIEVRAWKPGDQMPSKPLFRNADSTYSEGNSGIGLLNNVSRHGKANSKAIFRFVQIADERIQGEPLTNSD